MSNPKIKRKIFISYKYKDDSVHQVSGMQPGADTDYRITPRHYVDIIVTNLSEDTIYKGEKSDEDISHLRDDTIDSKLKGKIFDSSVTIVLISPKMKDTDKADRDQWIPNEVYYSLLNKSRGNQKSKTNAMVAVVLPDIHNAYCYAMIDRSCGVRCWRTNTFFYVLRANMFNRKWKRGIKCGICLSTHHVGSDHSYITPVLWQDFINNPNEYIELAVDLRNRLEEFQITKNIGNE